MMQPGLDQLARLGAATAACAGLRPLLLPAPRPDAAQRDAHLPGGGRTAVARSAWSRRHALPTVLAGEPIRSIVCSDARRAFDTAHAVAAPHRLTPVAQEGLRERNFGALIGTSSAAHRLGLRRPTAARRWRSSSTASALRSTRRWRIRRRCWWWRMAARSTCWRRCWACRSMPACSAMRSLLRFVRDGPDWRVEAAGAGRRPRSCRAWPERLRRHRRTIMEFKDYYSALGVERSASEDDVRKAYRKLARKYHPDVSKEADAEQRMRDINEANDVLRDKEKRAAYDALAEHVARGGTPRRRTSSRRRAGTRASSSIAARAAARPTTPSSASSSPRCSAPPSGAAPRGGNMRARGEDHHAAIEIALEDALHGGEREISLRAQEIDAQGQPDWVTRTLSVKIPPGVHPGQFIRLAGQGHAGPRRRAGRRPVPGSAHRATPALPRRRPRPVHDAAGDADRSRAGRAGAGADARPAAWSRSPCRPTRAAA